MLSSSYQTSQIQTCSYVILETLGIAVSQLEKFEAGFKREVVDPAPFLLVQTKEEASEASDLKHDWDEYQEYQEV